MRARLMIFIAAVLIIGTGCSGSGGGGGSNFANDVGRITANYQILNLATGAVEPQQAIDDLDSNAIYRTTHMVFRKVSGAHAIGVASGQMGDGVDPARQTIDLGTYYIGVYEVTQAQWALMAATTPWLDLTPVNADDVRVGDQRPVVGVSGADATTALTTYASTYDFTLSLPSDNQWEAACRGGTTSLFAWGDTLTGSTAATYAQVWDTAADLRGALPVGSLLANDYGLYDVHGNVAELTTEGHARGGAWGMAIATARSSHQADFGSSVTHVQVGMRLLYRLK